jgi:hypothetical protein
LWHLEAFAQPKNRTLQGAIGSWHSSGSLLDLTLRLLELHLCGSLSLCLQAANELHKPTFSVAMHISMHAAHALLPVTHCCILIRC